MGRNRQGRPARLGLPDPATAPDATTAGGAAERGDLAHRRSTVTTGTIDLLGILAASQALSSETSVERLHARVVEVLGAMTGATGVHLVLWSDERQDWLLPVSEGGAVRPGAEHAVPMSVLRYLQRTREPLVVADATSDDRFARDPYFAGVDACSLLAVPIVSRGTPQAVLVLENRLIRDAFPTERLDAVKLIAGQLAVSLDNAQLYADNRRIADEQAALRRVATLVAHQRPQAEVFGAIAEELGRLLAVDSMQMIRFEDDRAAIVVAGWGPLAPRCRSGRACHSGAGTSPRSSSAQAARRASTTTGARAGRWPSAWRGAYARRSERRSSRRAVCGAS